MRLIACFGLLFLSLSAFAAVEITEQSGRKNYRISVEDVSLTKSRDGRFSSANLVGVKGYEALLHAVGAPAIPVIRFYVEAADAQDIEFSFGVGQSLRQKESLQNLSFEPVAPSRMKLPIAEAKAMRDGRFYEVNALYPRVQGATIDEAVSVKGRKQFLVTLYPFHLNPVTGEMTLTREFEVSVKKPAVVKSEGDKTFVFIVGENFKNSPSLSDYKALKEGQGFRVEQFDVKASDSPDSIRARLKNLYAQSGVSLEYALIIGDSEHVQGKDADNCSGVTDHYYRAIDTNDYDSDINGPDIGVGRVTVKNEAELAVVLGKFTRYQQDDFTSLEWLGQISFLATDDRYEVAEGSHNYAIDTYTKDAGYAGAFPKANNPGGDQIYAITYRARGTQTVNALNQGRSIVNYSGHGAVTYWDAPSLSQDEVRAIQNTEALPFVISNACITGQFTADESFGETWLKAPNGAIMFWGSMDNTYWDEDDILEKRMYDGIFALGKRTFADITAHALKEMWKEYGGSGFSKYYWETYVTFGDPSIELKLNQ
jgi:hypothetical protein